MKHVHDQNNVHSLDQEGLSEYTNTKILYIFYLLTGIKFNIRITIPLSTDIKEQGTNYKI